MGAIVKVRNVKLGDGMPKICIPVTDTNLNDLKKSVNLIRNCLLYTSWYEYYEIQKDGSFILHTIAVAGFGAGIPAEMDCKYRYEDGLVYMDEIESVFPQFNWINSQTALKNIKRCV